MRPVCRLGDIRACGAVIIATPGNVNVYSTGRLVATYGSIDSHGGISQSLPLNVYVNNIPITRLFDINDVCKWVFPPHFAMPLVSGDNLVSSL